MNHDWMLIPGEVPPPPQSDVRGYSSALLASGGRGEDIRLVLANAFHALIADLPGDIHSFAFEGGVFDRNPASLPSRISLEEHESPVDIAAWRQTLSPRLKESAVDWPYSAKSLAAWRVILAGIEIMGRRQLGVLLGSTGKGCRITLEECGHG